MHAHVLNPTYTHREQKVDVTVYTYRNGVVRVEDGEATLYAAIDIVCDKVRARVCACVVWERASACSPAAPTAAPRLHPGCTTAAPPLLPRHCCPSPLLPCRCCPPLHHHRCHPAQLSRKMTKTKERAIAKGKWPGRAGDKGVAKAIEEAEEREQMEEVRALACGGV